MSKAKNSARKVSELLGDKTYIGIPCSVCRGAERYTINAACVACTKAKAKARYNTPEGKRVQLTRDRKRHRDKADKIAKGIENDDDLWN